MITIRMFESYTMQTSPVKDRILGKKKQAAVRRIYQVVEHTYTERMIPRQQRKHFSVCPQKGIVIFCMSAFEKPWQRIKESDILSLTKGLSHGSGRLSSAQTQRLMEWKKWRHRITEFFGLYPWCLSCPSGSFHMWAYRRKTNMIGNEILIPYWMTIASSAMVRWRQKQVWIWAPSMALLREGAQIQTCFCLQRTKAGLDLSTFHGLIKGGENGPVVLAGEAESSPL